MRFGEGARNDPARPRNRPQRLRRLPCLRDQLQGVEHFWQRRAIVRRTSLRRRSDRHIFQSRADLRGRTVSPYRNRALPQVLPALRRPALRAGVSDRGLLQAQGGRHRAGGLRQVHRLQVLLLGLPIRRARSGREAEGDEEMHAMRGSHLRQVAGRRSTANRPVSRPARPARACSATSTIRNRKCRWRYAKAAAMR